MKYDYIKRFKLSHEEISKAMGYNTVHTFRSSTAHKRMMKGIDRILEIVVDRMRERI